MRQEFLKKCEELLYDYIDPFEVPGALEAIKEALRSDDSLDLVRCGECGYWQRVALKFGRCAGGYMNKDIRTGETWFCAGGVRRADDETRNL